MSKNKHFKLIAILFIPMLMSMSNLMGQGSCGSPVILTAPIDSNISLADSVMWLKFVADTTSLEFYANTQSTTKAINKIEVSI